MTDTPGMGCCSSSISLPEITVCAHIGRASRSSKKYKITRIDTQLGMKLDPVIVVFGIRSEMLLDFLLYVIFYALKQSICNFNFKLIVYRKSFHFEEFIIR